MRGVLLVVMMFLAACARPLTTGERAFATDIFGETLEVDRVRVAVGLGLREPERIMPEVSKAPAPQGRLKTVPGLCDRVPQGPRTEPPPAFALWNRIHLVEKYYRPDTAPGWPDQVALPQALIMAHELVHVWQWQNRKRTGYRPARAALESVFNLDPYFYQPDDGEGFLNYGFEQQGALVEDYVCYGLFDPGNPRRSELRALLAPFFPVARLDRVIER